MLYSFLVPPSINQKKEEKEEEKLIASSINESRERERM